MLKDLVKVIIGDETVDQLNWLQFAANLFQNSRKLLSIESTSRKNQTIDELLVWTNPDLVSDVLTYRNT